MDYLVVRAAPSDRVTDRYGAQANVVVAPVGRLPGGLQASRSQVWLAGGGHQVWPLVVAGLPRCAAVV